MRRARVAALALVLVSLPVDGGTADRLSRVGVLRPILSGVSESAPADVDVAVAELFTLADDEIVENLAAGGPFASTGFIQERLDAFMAAWSGAGFRVYGLGPEGTAGSLTLGVFQPAGPGAARLGARFIDLAYQTLPTFSSAGAGAMIAHFHGAGWADRPSLFPMRPGAVQSGQLSA